MSDIATPKRRTRPSGSETRRLGQVERFRVTTEEQARITLAAERAGLVRSDYFRARLFGPETIRARRRPTIEFEALSRIMAQLGKCGSNLNQIARVLNSGGDEQRIDLTAALAEFSAACADIRRLAGGQPVEDVAA